MQNPLLVLSLEWPTDLLIMGESSGRAMARNLNIRITGTLGVLPFRKIQIVQHPQIL